MPMFSSNNNMSLVYNVKALGCYGNGQNDDTSKLQAILNSVGASSMSTVTAWMAGGTYLISAPITIPANVRLLGEGRNNTIIQATPGFAGASYLSFANESYARLSDMTIQGPTTTYSSNPAADAISLSGVTDCLFSNIEMYYINGWGFNSVGTSSTGDQKIVGTDLVTHFCKQGFHVQGVSGSSNVGLHQFTRCRASGTQFSDCWLIEDVHDIQMTDCGGEPTAGTGNTLHVKGVCGAIFCTNPDFGPASGTPSAPTVLVEGGSNGNPKSVTFLGGIMEGGTSGLSVTAGSAVKAIGTHFYNNGTYGVNCSGGNLMLRACSFDNNGSQGTSGRFDVRNNGATKMVVEGCSFTTPQGAGANQTNAVVNDVSQSMWFLNNSITGAGYTAANYYSTQPYVVRGITGFTSGSNITAPTIASGTAFSKNTDCLVCISGGTVSAVAIDGVATGLTQGMFFLEAQHTITPTYSVAPTWVWYAL